MRKSAGVLIASVALVVVATGCRHSQAAVQVSSEAVRVDCRNLKNSGPAVISIDATNKKRLNTSLPSTHEAEVCKGQHSILWFAEDGKNLKVSLLAEKNYQKPQDPGNSTQTLRCGNAFDEDGDLIGSLCLLKTVSGDKKGTIFYELGVDTKHDGRQPIDPRLIIKE